MNISGSELQIALQGIDDLLVEIEGRSRQEGPGREASVIAGYRPRVYTALTSLGETLLAYQQSALDDADADQLRSEVDEHLKRWSTTSPIFARIRELDRTRHTQHELMQYLQQTHLSGATISAMVLNDFFVHASCTVAERNRLVLLQNALRAELRSRTAAGARRVDVLCIQYVGGREWDWLSQEPGLGQALNLTYVDETSEALRHAQRSPIAGLAAVFQVHRSNGSHFLQSSRHTPGGFDVVYDLGLSDSSNQEEMARIVKGAARVLRPKGVLIAGSQTLHMPPGERALRSIMVDWDWHYRDERTWRTLLAAAPFDVENVTFTREPLDIALLLTAPRR